MTTDWIDVEVALRGYAEKLGLPPQALGMVLGKFKPKQPGIMWLSDHAIMVHATDSGLAFDRIEFEAVMREVKPVQLGGA